jgi:hypothetical protein
MSRTQRRIRHVTEAASARDRECLYRHERGVLAMNLFTVHHTLKNPLGEWCSGIEVGPRFYPSLGFPSKRAAQADDEAMNAALALNPAIAAHLRALIESRSWGPSGVRTLPLRIGGRNGGTSRPMAMRLRRAPRRSGALLRTMTDSNPANSRAGCVKSSPSHWD